MLRQNALNHFVIKSDEYNRELMQIIQVRRYTDIQIDKDKDWQTEWVVNALVAVTECPRGLSNDRARDKPECPVGREKAAAAAAERLVQSGESID